MEDKKIKLSLDSWRKLQKIEQLTTEEIQKRINTVNKLYEYIEEKPVDLKDPKQIEEINKIVTEIYKAEMDPLEEQFDLKMKFLIGEEGTPNEEEGKFWGLCTHDKNIKINTESLYKKLKKRNVNKRLEGCLDIIKVISHEIQHQRQAILMKKNQIGIPKKALQISESELLINILEKEFYEKNHDQMYIEKDSEEKANKRAIEAKKDITISEREEIINRLEKKLGKIPTSYISTKIYDNELEFFFLKQREEKVMEGIIDEIIAKRGDIDWLETYPVLQKKYDIKTGKRISVEQLLKNKEDEEKTFKLIEGLLTEEERKAAKRNIQEMYEELIYQQLENTTPEELKNIDKSKLKQILYQIKKSTIKETIQMKKDSKRAYELDEQYRQEELEKKPKIIKGILKLADNQKRFVKKILPKKEEEKFEKNGYTSDIEEYLKERLELIERIEKGEIKEEQQEETAIMLVEQYSRIKYKIKKFINKYIIEKTVGTFGKIKEKYKELKTKYTKKLEPENNLKTDERIELEELQKQKIESEEIKKTETKKFKEKYKIENNDKENYYKEVNQKETKQKNNEER